MVDLDHNRLSHNHITALFEDERGNILIGTENGFNILNPETKEIVAVLPGQHQGTRFE